MSPSDSPPVLPPTQSDSPPASGASLATRLPQTLVGTVERWSHVAPISWEDHDVRLLQVLWAAMIGALDVYNAMVTGNAPRLALAERVVPYGNVPSSPDAGARSCEAHSTRSVNGCAYPDDAYPTARAMCSALGGIQSSRPSRGPGV
jgi:hypothetical protein